MRYIPSWFPGAGFKRYAVEWKKLIEDFVNEPYEDCKRKIVSHLSVSPARVLTPLGTIQKNGTATPSFTSLAFEKNENMNEQEDFDLRWTTNSMYTASIDTVRSRSQTHFPRVFGAQLCSRPVPLLPTLFLPWFGIPTFLRRLRRRSTLSLDTRGYRALVTALRCLILRPC